MKNGRCMFIRTDGNPDIANGHLMRCLSIAGALTASGTAVVFCVADRISKELLLSFLEPREFFKIVVLQTDYRIHAGEPALLKPLLRAEQAGCILVDSYFVNQEYLQALRSFVRTAYIDDLTAFDYPVDLVINYDAEPDPAFYLSAGKKLLGSIYTPLRSQFQGLVPCVRPVAEHLLISTGGTDPYNLALTLASALEVSASPLRIHILTGPMHAHYKELLQFAAAHTNIYLHEHVRDMASLMCSCDLAVSAAGTTLFELCAAGVPAVSYTFCDNQLQTAADMEYFAGIPYAGDLRVLRKTVSAEHAVPETAADPEHSPGEYLADRNTITALVSTIHYLTATYTARQQLSAAMHTLVDGYGSRRIADALKDQLHSTP